MSRTIYMDILFNFEEYIWLIFITTVVLKMKQMHF